MRSLVPLLGAAALAAGFVTLPATGNAQPPAMAESGYANCKDLRSHYANGIAKNQKAARKAKKKGYKKPFVCIRVYRQVAPALDPNGNKVACERR